MKFVRAKSVDNLYSQLKLIWSCMKSTSKSLKSSRIAQDYDFMREGVVEWLLQEGKIAIKKDKAETLYNNVMYFIVHRLVHFIELIFFKD